MTPGELPAGAPPAEDLPERAGPAASPLTLSRALVAPRYVLTTVETAVTLAALVALFGVGREALALLLFGLTPLLAVLVTGYHLDQRRLVRSLDALLARARAGTLDAAGRAELAEALVSFPRRTVRTRLATWSALALVLAVGCVALADVPASLVMPITGACLCNAALFLLLRAEWFRVAAERVVLPALPGADPERYRGRTLRERLFAASFVPAGFGALSAGLYIGLFLQLPTERVWTLLVMVPPLGLVLAATLFVPELFRRTAPVRAWLAGRPALSPEDELFRLRDAPAAGEAPPDAEQALQAATSLPYRLAARMLLVWWAAGAALAVEHGLFHGAWPDALLVFAGTVAISLGVGLVQYVWVRALLQPARQACAQSLGVISLSELRPRLSLRLRMLAGVGVVLLAAILMASSTLYLQQQALVASAAGAEAREALSKLAPRLAGLQALSAAERATVLAANAPEVTGTLVWLGRGGIEWSSAPLAMSRDEQDELEQGWRVVRLRALRQTLAVHPLEGGAAVGLTRAWRRPGRVFGSGLAVLVAALTVLSGLMAWLAAADLTAPLAALQAFARRLGQGDLQAPVPVPDPDEIGELTVALDWMRGELRGRVQEVTELNLSLERKVAERTAELEKALADLQASRAELVHAEKMASVGRLAAGVAHEINNPLNFIANSLPPLQSTVEGARAVLALHAQGEHDGAAAERSRRKLDESLADLDDLLRLLRNGAQRTQEIVRGLRDFSRRDEGEPARPVDVAALLDETVALLRHELAGRVQVVRDYDSDSTVTGRQGALGQLFLNLVANAALAIAGPGTITLATRRGADALRISVKDSGCGIAPEVLPKIFEPFFTTREVGRGTGLGLAIVHGIVERHGGRISVKSEPGAGAEFLVELPLTAPERTPAPRA